MDIVYRDRHRYRYVVGVCLPFVFATGNDITFMSDEIKPSEQTHQLQDNFPIARQTSQDYTCTPTVFESSCEGFTSLKII